jgi:integrase
VLVLRLVAIRPALGPGLKYKAAISVAYGAGLRGGEVVMLRVCDISYVDAGGTRSGSFEGLLLTCAKQTL